MKNNNQSSLFTGKTCLVTGANTGLGFAVAKRFASQGAETILACRSQEKGKNAMNEIKAGVSDARVELMVCDLSSLKSVRDFVQEIMEKYSKLDVLYNNAAVMKQKRTVTEDGLEMMFQVNFLAPFILMNSFLDLLKESTSPFIVNNGRPSDKLRLDLDDLQFEKNYSMYNSFFKAKLCLLFSTLELSRRPERDGITVTMIDPGPFKSDLVRDVPLAGFFKNLFSSSVDKAADNLLYHIDPERADEKNGKVFKEREEYPLNEYWQDQATAKQIWTLAESLIQNK